MYTIYFVYSMGSLGLIGCMDVCVLNRSTQEMTNQIAETYTYMQFNGAVNPSNTPANSLSTHGPILHWLYQFAEVTDAAVVSADTLPVSGCVRT